MLLDYSTLARWLSSRPALWVAGLWGLAEASVFFIVPDVFLGLVALFAPRRVVATLGSIVIGAVIGAALLVVVSRIVPGGVVTAFLDRLPAVAPADLVDARSQLEAEGFVAFLTSPFQGVPVKVYVHEATKLDLPAPQILVFTALNRVERIGLFALMLTIVSVVGRGLIARFPGEVAIAYFGAWAAFYAIFWSARPG